MAINQKKVRILGYEVSLAEACILTGTALCVLAIFGYSSCYNINHCPYISPYYTGNYFGKYIPTFCIFAAGILLVFAASFQKPILFALSTLSMYAGIAGIIGMFISTIVEAGEFKNWIKSDITSNGIVANPNILFVGPSSKFWIWLAHVFIQGFITIFVLFMGASYAWQGFKLLTGGGRTYSRPENIAVASTPKKHDTQQLQPRFEHQRHDQGRVEHVERIEHTQHHHEEQHEDLQRSKYDEVPI